MLRKIAIIQARMSSSRLPGKVMVDIAGQPMLWHVIQRARQASLVDQVVVVTTTDPSDDILEQFCQKLGVLCYRGSLPDVLDRYYQAAVLFQADVVIRLTADCPLLDPHILDRTVLAFLGYQPDVEQIDPIDLDHIPRLSIPFDFAANRLPPPWKRSLPIGLDVEVCSMSALKRAWKEADQLFQREHVLPYLYEGVNFSQQDLPSHREWYLQKGTTPRRFTVALLNHLPDYGSLRWTVDTPADLEFVRQVYAHFKDKESFTWYQVLALLNAQPDLALINAEVKHKTAFDVDSRSEQN